MGSTLTFMLGSALAGLVGALYALLMGLTPTYGTNFLVESFVTVVVGGTFVGRIGILLIAIVSIRILPKGFSGLVDKRRR